MAHVCVWTSGAVSVSQERRTDSFSFTAAHHTVWGLDLWRRYEALLLSQIITMTTRDTARLPDLKLSETALQVTLWSWWRERQTSPTWSYCTVRPRVGLPEEQYNFARWIHFICQFSFHVCPSGDNLIGLSEDHRLRTTILLDVYLCSCNIEIILITFFETFNCI